MIHHLHSKVKNKEEKKLKGEGLIIEIDSLQLLSNKADIAGTFEPEPKKKKEWHALEYLQRIFLGTPGASASNHDAERIIHINQLELNEQQRFLHNRVFTGKYTFLTFIPIFLYEEFSKYANLFFLFISGIQVNDIPYKENRPLTRFI